MWMFEKRLTKRKFIISTANTHTQTNIVGSRVPNEMCRLHHHQIYYIRDVWLNVDIFKLEPKTHTQKKQNQFPKTNRARINLDFRFFSDSTPHQLEKKLIVITHTAVGFLFKLGFQDDQSKTLETIIEKQVHSQTLPIHSTFNLIMSETWPKILFLIFPTLDIQHESKIENKKKRNRKKSDNVHMLATLIAKDIKCFILFRFIIGQRWHS